MFRKIWFSTDGLNYNVCLCCSWCVTFLVQDSPLCVKWFKLWHLTTLTFYFIKYVTYQRYIIAEQYSKEITYSIYECVIPLSLSSDGEVTPFIYICSSYTASGLLIVSNSSTVLSSTINSTWFIELMRIRLTLWYWIHCKYYIKYDISPLVGPYFRALWLAVRQISKYQSNRRALKHGFHDPEIVQSTLQSSFRCFNRCSWYVVTTSRHIPCQNCQRRLTSLYAWSVW